MTNTIEDLRKEIISTIVDWAYYDVEMTPQEVKDYSIPLIALINLCIDKHKHNASGLCMRPLTTKAQKNRLCPNRAEPDGLCYSHHTSKPNASLRKTRSARNPKTKEYSRNT